MSLYNEIVTNARARGIASLSNTELIGLILGSGKRNHDQFKIAEELTEKDGLYTNVARASNVGELALLSAVELGKRLNSYVAVDMWPKITSPGDAAMYMMSVLRHETHEKFCVMLLNAKNRLMGVRQVSEGSLTSSVVHPREVLAHAIVAHAASIIAVHNHPSGDPYPSQEDRHLTETLKQAGEIIGIPLIDHLIIGDGRHYSFREHGEL